MHANAVLTPRYRLKAARLVVDEGPSISEMGARFKVSWPRVNRWVDRAVAGEPRHDCSLRTSPNKTGIEGDEGCVSLRMRLREGPIQLAARLHIAPTTVHRILKSARSNRLAYVDRATGRADSSPRARPPGSLVRVDVKKLGNSPDGGGWRYVGRRQGGKTALPRPVS